MALIQIRQTVINETFSGVVPIGGIIMYKGAIASLPSGWSFCDGTNGTPDLRDKFVIGAYADSSGQANTNVTGSTTKNGGVKDSIVVSHTHTPSITDSGHSHGNQNLGSAQAGPDNGGAPVPTSTGYSTSRTAANTVTSTTGISVSLDTVGSSGTNANLPPYYALAFIMRIS
jgi:hypothetical protein